MSRLMRSEIGVRASCALLLAVLSHASLTVRGQDRDGEPLWERVGATEAPERAPEVVSSQVVRVDVRRLTSSDNSRLALAMPDGATVVVVKSSEERPSGSGFVWHGQIAADPRSSVTFAVSKAVVVGTIRSSRGALYRLRYWKDDLHVVERLDPRAFPRELDPLAAFRSMPQPMEFDTCATDSGREVDVMMLYTDDARVAAGGTDAMDATVYLVVAETNQSYIDSNVRQRLRLVRVAEVDYAETGDLASDRNALRSKSDNMLDEVHTVRDQHAADVVALLTETGQCGAAYIMETVSNTFEDSAFAVVTRSCAMSNLSFGHELGHIMSARHDRVVDGTENSPYAYNHAHLQPQPTGAEAPWRTIMAYNDGCGAGTATAAPVYCIRQPYWSNPDVTLGGDAMGKADWEDNHRTLNNTALTVANFRCSSPNRPGVWMKDTWSDTGAEPEPNQSNEPMWKSPYIWVRTAADPERLHQHEHENPQSGQAQFIYVKVHNGGGAASGTLEVYGALAATGLSWPNDWSMLVSIPTSIPAHASTIVEAPWTPTAGEHYCLVARWVSASDPMTTPEGPDLSLNVRANNNLIWRNVNIANLVSGASDTATFIVRNVDHKPRQFALDIRPSAQSNASFIGVGTVTLTLPPELRKYWSKSRYAGSGFRRQRSSVIVTRPMGAILEGLRLPPRFEAAVHIRFARPRARFPRDAYELDIVQSVGERERPAVVVGGVTYEIRTNWLGR